MRDLLWTIFVNEHSFNGRVRKAIGYDFGNLSEDLCSRDESLNNDYKMLYECIEKLDNRINEHSAAPASVTAFNNALVELDERLNRIENYLKHQRNSSPGNTDDFQAQISDLQRELVKLKTRFADKNLVESLQIQLRNIAAVSNSNTREKPALQQLVEQQNKELSAQNQRLRALDQLLDEQKQRLHEQEQILRDQQLLLRDQEKRLYELEQQNKAQSQAFNELQQQVAKLLAEDKREVAPQSVSAVPPQPVVTTPPLPVSPFPLQPVKKTAEPTLPRPAALPPVSKPSASAAVPSSAPVPPHPAKPWISFFSLPEPSPRQAVFQGDGTAVKKRFAQSISEIDALANSLNDLSIAEPAKTSFSKNIRHCKEALEKFYNKFKFEDCEEDELSATVTDKFFKIISDNLLENVVMAINSGDQETADYEQLLQNVNRFLSSYGIYTQYISPGMPVKDETIIHNVEPPFLKTTTVQSNSGIIDRVELLPYFITYEDDEGRLDTMRKRGRVICWQYGG